MMKLLAITLLFISTLTFANVKVSVTRNNKITNQATFETQLEADEWVTDNEKILKGKSHRNSFGIVEHWTKREIEGAETRTIEIESEIEDEILDYTEYKFLQNYEVSMKDISVQVAQEKTKRDLKAKNKKDLKEILEIQDLNLKQINRLLREMI